MTRFLTLTILGLWATSACSSCVRADLVRLRDGGEIRGEIQEKTNGPHGTITVETIAGALITVSNEEIEFQTRRPRVYEIYELKARLAGDDAAEQWKLAEWCQKNRLERQREEHLEQILLLEPDNDAAHRALGHVKKQGEWTTYEEHMASRGYVRHRGRYITPEELMLLETSATQREQQREWLEKVKLWKEWLDGSDRARIETAQKQLAAITEAEAVPALRRHLGSHPNRNVRQLHIETLSQIEDGAATESLVAQGLFDDDIGIRRQSIQAIASTQTDLAIRELISHLQDDRNLIVRRAASALQTIGNKKAVPSLIEALVTRHKYRIETTVPVTGVSISNGNVSGLQAPLLPPDLRAGLLTGIIPPENVILPNSAKAKQWKVIQVEQRNPEVLLALQEITKADFGYDERTWKLWWLSENS